MYTGWICRTCQNTALTRSAMSFVCACGGTGRWEGSDPDEFAVPLAMPPQFPAPPAAASFDEDTPCPILATVAHS
jgi:hypothetical protein